MADDMLNVVKYDAGGVEIKLDPATVKNYLVRGNGKVTDQEVLFFIRTCQAQKLNPLVYGEVYLIKFGDEPAQLVIGKETYMKRAFKNPNYSGMKSGIVVQRGEEIVQKEGTCLYPTEEVQRYREIGTVEEFRKTADRNNQKQPVWKNGRSTIFKDYVDGHGEAEENKWADWVCPECGWFVGEQYLPRQHNQSKCNFCPKCGQAIRWEN